MKNAFLKRTPWMMAALMFKAAGALGETTPSADAPAAKAAPAWQPYSADETKEQIRTLPDGARASKVLSTTHVYRDSRGRTRREVSFTDASGATSNVTAIIISDGVVGARWELDPATLTAFRETLARPGGRPGAEGERRESGRTGERERGPEGEHRDGEHREGERREGEHRDGEHREGEHREGEHREGGRGGERDGREGEHRDGGEAGIRGGSEKGGRSRQHEDLGFKTMEGLQVHGSRNSWTAGAGGDANAGVIIDERWVAPDLGVALKSIHSDPRLGETVVTLTHVRQGEPDPALFQVPPGYTVKQASQGKETAR